MIIIIIPLFNQECPGQDRLPNKWFQLGLGFRAKFSAGNNKGHLSNDPQLPHISISANAFFSELSGKAMKLFQTVHNDEVKMYNQL